MVSMWFVPVPHVVAPVPAKGFFHLFWFISIQENSHFTQAISSGDCCCQLKEFQKSNEITFISYNLHLKTQGLHIFFGEQEESA